MRITVNEAKSPSGRYPPAKLARPTNIDRHLERTASGLLWFSRSSRNWVKFRELQRLVVDFDFVGSEKMKCEHVELCVAYVQKIIFNISYNLYLFARLSSGRRIFLSVHYCSVSDKKLRKDYLKSRVLSPI
jgi:hypothetical protein